MKWQFMSYYEKMSDKGMKNKVTMEKWISTNDDSNEIIMTNWWINMYRVRDPTLSRRFLRVILLECYFDFITYIHIPRRIIKFLIHMKITF